MMDAAVRSQARHIFSLPLVQLDRPVGKTLALFEGPRHYKSGWQSTAHTASIVLDSIYVYIFYPPHIPHKQTPASYQQLEPFQPRNSH